MKHYENKQELIRDIIKHCSISKKQGIKYDYIMFDIQNEIWKIDIFYRTPTLIELNNAGFPLGYKRGSKRKQQCIMTEMWCMIMNNGLHHYPLTIWGENVDTGYRWDNDLRAFLQRELCKK